MSSVQKSINTTEDENDSDDERIDFNFNIVESNPKIFGLSVRDHTITKFNVLIIFITQFNFSFELSVNTNFASYLLRD